MNGLQTVSINKNDIAVKEYQGKRVVTLKDIDLCHNRPDGTARRNFNQNKQHLIEGTDFFKVCADEIRTHKIMDISAKTREDVTLITESGYLMLVKSFTDDLAWDVQRQLVNTYFRTEQKATDNTLKIQMQQERSRAMLMNAACRMFKMLKDNSNDPIALSIAKQLGLSIPEQQTIPVLAEKTYSATEVGNAFGVSAAKVGKIANQYNLKTDEYGAWYKDKSKYSPKEVSTFRYNETGKKRIGELLVNGKERSK